METALYPCDLEAITVLGKSGASLILNVQMNCLEFAVHQESPRQTKPKKGPKRKVHEFRPFLWILVFFLRKTSTIHIELLFRNAPAKSSWTDFFWFGLLGPLLSTMTSKTCLLCKPIHFTNQDHGMFRRSPSLAILHRKSFAAISPVSLELLGHTNRSVKFSYELQREIALVWHFQDQLAIPYYQQEAGKEKRACVSQGMCFWRFAGRWHRAIRIRIRIAAASLDAMPLKFTNQDQFLEFMFCNGQPQFDKEQEALTT